MNGACDARSALELWQRLVCGEWTVLDSFRLRGRLFILAKRSGRRCAHRHELTAREDEVLLCAALGESRKATGYRLGLSRSRVSTLLGSAMRKLGVRNQAQLVLLMQGFRHYAEAG